MKQIKIKKVQFSPAKSKYMEFFNKEKSIHTLQNELYKQLTKTQLKSIREVCNIEF